MMITQESIQRWQKLSAKEVVGAAMSLIAEEDHNLAAAFADCATRIALAPLQEKYPQMCVQVGIAEQNLITVSAGMAHEGFNVFAVAYAPFISVRSLEQAKVNCAYAEAPVTLIGLESGFAIGHLGATHMALEDVGYFRILPNMFVVSPADCVEAMYALFAAAKCNSPVYLCLTAVSPERIVNTMPYDFELGKAITLRQGKDIAIITNGTITYNALKAAEILAERGIECAVINMHTVKPLDTDAIDKLRGYQKIFTVDEHYISGGLGGAVAEYMAQSGGFPRLKCIGVDDRFYPAYSRDHLIEIAGLTPRGIAERIFGGIKAIL